MIKVLDCFVALGHTHLLTHIHTHGNTHKHTHTQGHIGVKGYESELVQPSLCYQITSHFQVWIEFDSGPTHNLLLSVA